MYILVLSSTFLLIKKRLKLLASEYLMSWMYFLQLKLDNPDIIKIISFDVFLFFKKIAFNIPLKYICSFYWNPTSFFFYKKQYMLNVKKQENESHLWSYNFRIFK